MHFGTARKIGFSRFSGADGSDESLIVRGDGFAGNLPPFAFVEPRAVADFERGCRDFRIHRDRALGAGDFQGQAVGMAPHPPAGVDCSQRAVGEFDVQNRRVICIKLVFGDPVAGGLVKSTHPAVNLFDGAAGKSGVVDDMNSYISKNTLAAVGGRQPPQPSRSLPPIAPDFRRQPSLQVTGFHVAQLADFSTRHDLGSSLNARPVAVGKIHHVHDSGPLCGGDHLFGVSVVQREGFFAKHMLAGFQTKKRKRRMKGIRRDDCHCIKIRSCQKCFGAGKRL